MKTKAVCIAIGTVIGLALAEPLFTVIVRKVVNKSYVAG